MNFSEKEAASIAINAASFYCAVNYFIALYLDFSFGLFRLYSEL
jgi:hypothetical protein